jgi:hypothetical protein
MRPASSLPVVQRLLWCALPALAGLALAAGLLLIAGGPARPALAAPASVTFPGCAPTLQECLDTAAEGETIVVQPGTYTTSLTLSRAVSLTGVSSDTVILQALAGQRVLTVTGAAVDASVVISGLTLTGGHAAGEFGCPEGCGGGLAAIYAATPRLFNLKIVSNTARAGGGLFATNDLFASNLQVLSNTATPGSGGGVLVSGHAELQGGLFQGNGSDEYGGGLVTGSDAVMTGTVFISNTAHNQGGGASIGWLAQLTDVRFEHNACPFSSCHGGGLFASVLELRDTYFLGNLAYQGGGAHANAGSIQGGVFQGNQSEYYGGGLVVQSGGLVLTGTRFISNAGAVAGGMWATGEVAMRAAHFEGNQALQAGGGGFLAGLLTMTDTVVISNTAYGSGGGAASTVAAVWGGLFQGNICTHPANPCWGGGLYVQGNLAVTGTEFVSNTANTYGGGAFGGSYQDANVTLNGARFVGNHAASGGGIYTYHTLHMTNTVFVGNTVPGNGGGAWGNAAHLLGGLFQENASGELNSGGGLAANTVTLSGTRFLSNTARSGGGAWAVEATLAGGWFQGNQGSGLFINGGNLWLTGTQFINNASLTRGGGLQANGSSRVVNALFAGNSANLGGAALSLSSGNHTLLHTTIASPSVASGSAVAIASGQVGITNSIIASHTIGISLTAGTANEDYNLFFGNGTDRIGGVSGGAHAVSGDPRFANPPELDYHLIPGSAALDVGTGAGVHLDFEGDPRSQRCGFDMGYDELPVGCVNDAPAAGADSYSTSEDSPLLVPVPGVLANDSDPNADAIIAVMTTAPATGTLVLLPSGAFTYTPPLNFNGLVTFTYQASDRELLSAPALVSLTVTPVNDPPMLAAPSDVIVGFGTATVGPLPFTVGDVETPASSLDVTSEVSNPALVTSAALGGSGAARTLTLSLGPGQTGTATITITVMDTASAQTNAAFQLTVAPEAPVVVVADSYATPEDTPLLVPAPGVLSNDTDPDADALTAVVATPPVGTLALQSSGAFTYAPPLNFAGLVTFTYQASDGGLLSNPALVTITVTPVNDPPTLSVPADVTVTAGIASAGPFTFTVGDLETPAASLVVSATSSNEALAPTVGIVLGGSGLTRTVTVGLTTAETGTGLITITVTDADGAAPSVQFRLTVVADVRRLYLPLIRGP